MTLSYNNQHELADIKALVSKGDAMRMQSKFMEAIIVYDEIILRYGDHDAPDIRERVALALVTKGEVLWWQNETEAAVIAYNDIIHRFGTDNETPVVREFVARAHKNLGKCF